MNDLLPLLVPALWSASGLVRRAMDNRFYRRLVADHGLKPEKLAEVIRAHREASLRPPRKSAPP